MEPHQTLGEPSNPQKTSCSDINSNEPRLQESKAGSFTGKTRGASADSHDKPASYLKNRKEYHEREDHFDPDVLNKFESAPTYPCHTAVYKSWLKINAPFKSNGESWLFIGIIAVLMGIISFVIKQTVDKLYIFQYGIVQRCLKHRDPMKLWLYYSGLSACFSVMSSLIVVYICPSTAGSGMPELMAILNGVVVRKMLSVKVLFWKIISSVMSILSTLPVGFEGPMIHIGSMVPTILTANYKCWTNIKAPENRYANDSNRGCRIRRWFARINTCLRSDLCRLRDGHERQLLACTGAASGFAAALSAPITGLCFSMEEMSSNWSNTRTWQTLFCCIFACTINAILRTLFSEIKQPTFFIDYPLIEMSPFDLRERSLVWMSILIPAVCLGIVGGLAASMFIAMHLKIMRIKSSWKKDLNRHVASAVKIFDVLLLSVLFTSFVILILSAHKCQPLKKSYHITENRNPELKLLEIVGYGCRVHAIDSTNKSLMLQKGEYHEVATLFLNTWEQLIRNMFSRRTHGFFSPAPLSIALTMIFFFASLASSASLSGGLMISQLAIGSLYGRMFGETIYSLVNIYGGKFIRSEQIDPGLYALLGSASFFAGTSRLPITTVVMMVEMTNDANYIFAIMITVLIAKYVGDCLTQSLYHSLMELKSMPYLDSELKIYWDNKRLNLEIFEVRDVMAAPVHCLEMITSVRGLADIITTTQHGAFPVVKGNLKGSHDNPMCLLGVISRMEIVILLCNLDIESIDLDLYNLTKVDIERLQQMYSGYGRNLKLRNFEGLNKLMNVYLHDAHYTDLLIDLAPYLDTSTIRIPTSFSLERTYNLFRHMGLRHLVVVDGSNQVVGIITRKDLLEFVVEKRIHGLISESIPVPGSSSVVLCSDDDETSGAISNGNLITFQEGDQET